LNRGWASAHAPSLWEDDRVITPDQKHGLDLIEPFHEWEELHSFAGHHGFLVATSYETGSNISAMDVVEPNDHPIMMTTSGLPDCKAERPSATSSITEYDLDDVTTTLLDSKTPFVLKNVTMGSCTDRWDLTYLEDKVGSDTTISIHKGTTQHLQFASKNYVYETVPFSRFRSHLQQNAHVYLRSLATKSPFRRPANFWTDFPGLAPDFQIPEMLKDLCGLPDNLHSSVLRVSGDVAIWLHYDVMSNFLFQARGAKTVALFRPERATDLGFAPGSTVSPLPLESIAAASDPSAGGRGSSSSSSSSSPTHVVRLRAGDALFIPRFWPHATFPAAPEEGQGGAPGPSVAVNVFWRDLCRAHYAAGRDVYGSRDVAAYWGGRESLRRVTARLVEGGAAIATARAAELAGWLREGVSPGGIGKMAGGLEVTNIVRSMDLLPADVGRFYRPRLAGELIALVEEMAAAVDS
jgi:tRNA wybutosine-synthesizing protein 4